METGVDWDGTSLELSMSTGVVALLDIVDGREDSSDCSVRADTGDAKDVRDSSISSRVGVLRGM